VGVDADLISFYDAEARGGHRAGLGDLRIGLRRGFAATLPRAVRPRVVDVGSGPGLDAAEWQRDGFEVVGVDLAVANVQVMQARGLPGIAGSLFQLPLRGASFDALWTMSTFVHVPDERFDDAITEMLRVVKPGTSLGIGTWGGRDFEGVPEFGELRPYRFFSLRSHDRWRQMLTKHGLVERFDTFASTGGQGWEYQFAVLRARR
jgi:SAM-dependent methyltransferase